MFQLGSLPTRCFQFTSVFVLLLLIPLRDRQTDGAHAAYDRAYVLFLHGSLKDSQSEAEQGYKRYLNWSPGWAAKFQLLEARAMIGRGMNEEALRILSMQPSVLNGQEEIIEKLTLEGAAFAYLHQFDAANQRLMDAKNRCSSVSYAACGGVPIRRGILANRRGQIVEARQFFLEGLSFARTHQDRWLEATALLNLGYVSLQDEHYDEAMGTLRGAYQRAVESGAEDQAQMCQGNLGWAYLKLGDTQKALELFLDAKNHAKTLGDLRFELKWVTAAGYVYRDAGDLTRAIQADHDSLVLATQINSKEDTVNALEDLAQASIDAGKLDEATAYIDQVNPLIKASGNHLDALDVMLAQARIAVARREDLQAETIFRVVEHDPASQMSMRLGSEHEMAKLFEREGNTVAAGQMYRTALTTFESARAKLKNEDSKLPFLANATSIYDDYIQLLVKQGKSEEALLAADQSRARTLAQGLGQIGDKESFHPAAISPQMVARKTGATLLFYWLGQQESYLWAVTPQRIECFPLPAKRAISARVERYSEALLESQDPRQGDNEDGQALFQLLVKPALKLIQTHARAVILSDGALTRLNFETLLAPGPSPIPEQKPGAEPSATAHYWIDDVTLFSAPSIAMLAGAKPARDAAKSLLLIGNAVSHSADFPSLPLFGFEMGLIEKKFTVHKPVVFAGQQANAAAYLASNPAQYSYIHFVAHAVASRTDPLDSAIILSPTTGEESFKLYARDIIQRPIDARLVTISACYGSGTRFYAGEGLVGLSWAFLRAGAHSVIGALWEVSDDSTPRLMEALYRGIEAGQTPEAALRSAKLALVHSQGKFRAPFYWAPFQLYSRL